MSQFLIDEEYKESFNDQGKVSISRNDKRFGVGDGIIFFPDSYEKELVKGLNYSTNSEGNISLNSIISQLTKIGFNLRNSSVSYYGPIEKMFIFGGKIPVDYSSNFIPSNGIMNSRIKLRFRFCSNQNNSSSLLLSVKKDIQTSTFSNVQLMKPENLLTDTGVLDQFEGEYKNKLDELIQCDNLFNENSFDEGDSKLISFPNSDQGYFQILNDGFSPLQPNHSYRPAENCDNLGTKALTFQFSKLVGKEIEETVTSDSYIASNKSNLENINRLENIKQENGFDAQEKYTIEQVVNTVTQYRLDPNSKHDENLEEGYQHIEYGWSYGFNYDNNFKSSFKMLKQFNYEHGFK